MKTRRTIIGIAVFIFAGLLLLTFANPSQVQEGEGNGSTNENKQDVQENIPTQEENNETDNETDNETAPVNNPVTPEPERDNTRDLLIDELESLLGYVEENYTTESYNPYKELLDEVLDEDGNLDVDSMSNDEIRDIINDLRDAINNLVELELVSLTVNPTSKTYKRLDEQEELTFTAHYNDSTRDKKVEANTTDTFDSSVVASNKAMTYTYADKYGSADALYTYSVIKNDRDNLLDKLNELLDEEINEEDYTKDSVDNYNETKENIDVTDDTTEEEIQDMIDDIEDAKESLVELELTSLTVDKTNTVYKRLDEQEELTFTAHYNDSTRDKEVEANTTDTFDSSVVASNKTMTYTYADKYGSADALYTYSVIKNDRDNLLDKLNELLDEEINEEDYTKDSVDNYNETKENIDVTDDTTEEEIQDMIDAIEEAKESLVELELVSLTVNPTSKTYKRLELQETLTFMAHYNDITKNKQVEATTLDTFDTSAVASNKAMTYTYADKYGSADALYTYSVIKNDRDNLLDKLNELLDETINEEDYTKDSVEDYNDAKSSAVVTDDTTEEEIQDMIDAIEEAKESLVELELTSLTVDKTNTVYKRLDEQEELTFTAHYNDSTRDKEVEAATLDTFDSSVVASNKTMTYTYADKYGEANAIYTYSVVKNNRDNLLDELNALLDEEINEEDYTTDSVENYNATKAVVDVTDDTTEEEIQDMIDAIKEAKESLVELELTSLTVDKTNTVYKRLESQEELTFTAHYNDSTRDKEVETNTTDTFDSSAVASNKTMTYTYADKYGEANATYTYSVVNNDRDNLLDRLNELLNEEINEEDYTKDSVEDYNDAKASAVVTENTTEEEIQDMIDAIEEAKESLVELELTSLTVNKTNTVYKRLDEQEELTFTAHYNDSTRDKEVEAATLDTFDSSVVASNKIMTYTYADKYGSKNTTYTYSVERNDEDKEIVSISANLTQTDFGYKTNVNARDYLNVSLVARDGVKTLTNDYTTNGINTSSLGKNTLTVSIEGYSSIDLQYTVSRTEEGCQLNHITASLSRSEFVRNEEVNFGELLTVTVYDNDGVSYEVEGFDISDADLSTIGNKTLTVSYTREETTKTTTVNYTVVRNDDDKKTGSIEATINKTTYAVNESIGILTVKKVSKDGIDKTVINDNEYTVTGFDTDTEGNRTMTISYEENGETYTTTIDYSVKEQYLFDIEYKNDRIYITDRYIDLIEIEEIKVKYTNRYTNNGNVTYYPEEKVLKLNHFYQIGSGETYYHPVLKQNVTLDIEYRTDSLQDLLSATRTPDEVTIKYKRNGGEGYKNYSITYKYNSDTNKFTFLKKN